LAAGGLESVPSGRRRATPGGSDIDDAEEGRANVARTRYMSLSGSAAGQGEGDSTDGYTTTSGDEEEPPAHRQRTPTEAAAAAANRAARRVLMYEVE